MMTTETTSAANRRSEPRERVRQRGLVFSRKGPDERRCIVFDVSPSGARIKVEDWRNLPDTFALQIEDGPVRQAEVRSRKVGVLSVRFLSEEELQANAAE